MQEKIYEASRVAIDPVIFTIHENKLKVLLHTREKEPCMSLQELPGGLLLPDETAEETLRRKLKQLVGQENIFFKQFHTFTEPNRDPRNRTVSIAYISLINQTRIKQTVKWHDYETINELAFDHMHILVAARKYLKANLDHNIVKHFMPKLFPLNKLQEVTQLIEQTTYDNRNFRKKMINSGIVKQTNKVEQNVSHRPAKLYKFN